MKIIKKTTSYAKNSCSKVLSQILFMAATAFSITANSILVPIMDFKLLRVFADVIERLPLVKVLLLAMVFISTVAILNADKIAFLLEILAML